MKGLKTQEKKKFKRFFKIVQREAERQNAVFFLEAGDGREFSTETLDGEDLQGWLIPQDRADEFQKQWINNNFTEDWDDFFGFAIWEKDGETVKIRFDI